MAKIAVVEDNDAMRAQLCGFIAQYAQESGHQLDVTAFSDGAQLVEPYRPGFDIIFLDIEMPKLGGMPTAERIRRQDPDVVLVFVTNMAQYAIRGYEVDALDFVLKPVSYYQFSTKLERALQRIQRRRGGQVALQVSGGVQLLDTDDILYLETRDRLLHYHTATDTWSVRGSLLKAEKDLAAYHFARCNQCYLVNLQYVKAVENDFVHINTDRLEISRRQRAAFLTAVAFCLPLKHRPGFRLRTLGMLLPLIGLTYVLDPAAQSTSLHELQFSLLALYVSFFVLLGMMIYACVEIDRKGALYCAMWSLLTSQTAYEGWWLAEVLFERRGTPLDIDGLPVRLAQLTIGTVFYFVICNALSRKMSYKGEYHIGPRQLTSAFFVGILFMFQAALLSSREMFEMPASIAGTVLIGQFYFLTLLYFQTEVFKKSAYRK